MALPLYLALSRLEMDGIHTLPPHPAYMACHFSPGSDGISNCPVSLPENTLLILDDSLPMDDHDPRRVLRELEAQLAFHHCQGLLLDFQRPGIPEQQELAQLLCTALPCPVVVSEPYAAALSCPVLLPPVPPDWLLREYLKPWHSREIWLEAALDGLTLTLTETGCTITPLPDFPAEGQADVHLHCRYTMEPSETSAVFHLWRTQQDLEELWKEAENLGVTAAVGLWQELG